MESNRASDGTFKKGTHWRKPQKHWSKEWLYEEYITKCRSSAEIASKCGCGEQNILYWLHKHGIKRRTMAEVRSVKHWGVTGAANPMYGKCEAANPNWLGGVTPERQREYSRALWKQVKRAVRERDEGKCRRCGNVVPGAKQMHTHHIHPWARHPSRRFDIDNIVTLCRSCHGWVHGRENLNREFLVP